MGIELIIKEEKVKELIKEEKAIYMIRDSDYVLLFNHNLLFKIGNEYKTND